MNSGSIYFSLVIIAIAFLSDAMAKHPTDNTLEFCWNSTGPTGILDGHRYQLVIVDKLSVVELQCNDW